MSEKENDIKAEIENNSANLENDYITNISENKGFIVNLIDKIKSNLQGKNQKLLNSGNTNKTHSTNNSIASLWGMGSLRTSVFNAVAKVTSIGANLFSKKEEPFINHIEPKIVGEENTNGKVAQDKTINQNVKENTLSQSPIIPTATKPFQPKTSTLSVENLQVDSSKINTISKDQKNTNVIKKNNQDNKNIEDNRSYDER